MPSERLLQPGSWWVFELASDNRRVIAEAFPLEHGVAFADIGWDTPDGAGQPFHFVRGELKDDGEGFKVGDARIVPITEEDALAWEWVNWVNYRGTAAGKSATREACDSAMRALRLEEL